MGEVSNVSNVHVSAIAGAMSGGLARFLVAPLDVVKIRFQLQIDPKKVVPDHYSPNYHYDSIRNAFFTIYKQEGIRGLWRGNLLAEVLWITFAGVQFSSFALYKNLLSLSTQTKDGQLPKGYSLLCGGLAGFTGTCFVYPLDLLRTRFAAQSIPMVHPTIVSAVTLIYRTQGITGFYYGICPSLWQLVPYAAVQFFIYDSMKATVSQKVSHPYDSALTGGLAGLGAKLCVLPLDVIKKRLQIHGLNLFRKGIIPRRCPSLIDTVKNIYSSEGPKAFFKGSIPSLLKATTQTALVFTLYEQSRIIVTKFLTNFNA